MKKVIVAMEVEEDETDDLILSINSFLKTKAPRVYYEIHKVQSIEIQLEEDNENDNSG